MTYTEKILNLHPDAASWQRQYPWFATGHVMAAYRSKGTSTFEPLAQKAAAFFNSIPRLHWLLHQPDWEDETNLIPPSREEAVHDSTVETGLQQAIPKENVPNVQEWKPESDKEIPSLSQTFETHPQFSIDLPGQRDDEETPLDEEPETVQLPASPLSHSLSDTAKRFKDDSVADDSLLFETAYQHTIDYFASQGIKLEGEPAQDDRFGQQLKTFTSWLRQMKRLPTAPEPDTDPMVETHAAHSLQKGEVVTEPMVDVLLKQGKKQQALQVLEKLRLLHPEKSLYFATRYEQIKHSK